MKRNISINSTQFCLVKAEQGSYLLLHIPVQALTRTHQTARNTEIVQLILLKIWINN